MNISIPIFKFENPVYSDEAKTQITAIVDGMLTFFPTDENNIHYQSFVQQGLTAKPFPGRRVGSWLETFNLFTPAEQRELVQETYTNLDVKLWCDTTIAANVVNTESDEFIDVLKTLVKSNVITQERSEEIANSSFPEFPT